MTTTKKLRARDMKRNELQDAVREGTGFAVKTFEHHRVLILGAGAGILVVGLLVGGFLLVRHHDEESAQAELRKALASFEDAEAAAATLPGMPAPAETPPTWADVTKSFQDIATEHPRTAAADVALQHAGLAQLRAGEAAEAVKTLSDLVDRTRGEWMEPHALAALATAQEDAGDVAAAQATLERLAGSDWRTYPRGAAYLALGELSERRGQPDAARTWYEKLTEDDAFSESLYVTTAKAKLEALDG